MDQPGVEIRPINQLTGDSEFNETWFNAAITDADNILGPPGEGWKVAMGLLGFERGVSTLSQQLNFDAELAAVIDVARARGVADDPVVRQRLAALWGRLHIMRASSLRALSADSALGGTASPVGMIGKLYWASLHRDLGELAFDIMGMEATVGRLLDDDVVGRLRRVFLFSRADTIYGGSNQIQRNIIGERGLGLPR
jgi:alkylation response protein AidB-like acyl-CoA dehydrogenase